jgi:hypothetical protein
VNPFNARIIHDNYEHPARCVVIAMTGRNINGHPEFVVIVDDGTVKTATTRELIAAEYKPAGKS